MKRKPWTLNQIKEAIDREPHVSALQPAAMKILAGEVAEKEKKGQYKVVLWDSIKENPPEELKMSPIAMIPHKYPLFQAILDLSFALRLKNGKLIPLINGCL